MQRLWSLSFAHLLKDVKISFEVSVRSSKNLSAIHNYASASRYARHGRDLKHANKLDALKCRTTRYRKSSIPAVVDTFNSQFFIV